MPATVLCARANAQIDHGGHKYGANQSWWCPGFDQVLNTVTVVGSKPDELPVEHELAHGAFYQNSVAVFEYNGSHGEFRSVYNNAVVDPVNLIQPVTRLGPVARYEAPAPEVKEPTGLGAVVPDRLEDPWVRGTDELWHGPADHPYHWGHIPRPVVVCSEGWKP